MALSASGLDTNRFQFLGFLPKKKGQLTKLLQEILIYPGTSICYESPFRLKPVLTLLETLDPQRKIVIARELTKKFEEFIIGTPLSFKDRLQNQQLKGELVLLISGC